MVYMLLTAVQFNILTFNEYMLYYLAMYAHSYLLWLQPAILGENQAHRITDMGKHRDPSSSNTQIYKYRIMRCGISILRYINVTN